MQKAMNERQMNAALKRNRVTSRGKVCRSPANEDLQILNSAKLSRDGAKPRNAFSLSLYPAPHHSRTISTVYLLTSHIIQPARHPLHPTKIAPITHCPWLPKLPRASMPDTSTHSPTKLFVSWVKLSPCEATRLLSMRMAPSTSI